MSISLSLMQEPEKNLWASQQAGPEGSRMILIQENYKD
jgi:hypothetical protein